jgi:hypothetical protein
LPDLGRDGSGSSGYSSNNTTNTESANDFKLVLERIPDIDESDDTRALS